ncbi:MAG TPA: PEGA domain-containing protein [Kofleriaceae bacterium]
MGRLVLAGALVMAAMGSAHAGPTRKVQIDSEPPGATVYIDDIENGVKCEQTPCTIDVPLGSRLIILRLDRYEAEVAEVDVTRGKRPLQQKFKLKSAIGTIRVDMPKGAAVRVDDEDKGKAPVEVQTAAGEAHHVVVSFNGKPVFDDVVEVATGDEFVVKPKMAAGSTAVADSDATVTDDDDNSEGGGGGGSSGGGNAGSTKITDNNKESSTPRSAYLNAAAAFDVGFRHFTYGQAMSNNLREETEGGQVMGGPAIEVWPGRMLGVGPLRGLSLFVRLQFPVAGQSVEGGDLMGTVKTKWSSYEFSLRQRWVFGGFGVEASGGYVQDTMTFAATVVGDLDKMPDANYQSVRLGGKLAYMTEQVEPYVSAENRIVLSGGPLGDRFDTAKASGLRGSVGLAMKFGAVAANVAGTLMNYSWQFTYDGQNDVAQAKSATDAVKLISLQLGYSY